MMNVKYVCIFCSYEHFRVQKLHVCSLDTNWSLDIKRAILNILQVKLQADKDDYLRTENLPYNKLDKENVTTFDVLEVFKNFNLISY